MSKKVLTIVAVVIILSGLGIAAYVLSNRGNNEDGGTATKNCTTYNGAVEEQCAEDYIGLPREEAVNRARNAGLFPKVNKIDGEDQLNTLEGSTPIYFEIENGIIVDAYFEDDIPSQDSNR